MPLVVIRACPFPSSHKLPGTITKLELQKKCFQSVLKANDCNANILVLADSMETEDVFPGVEIIKSPVHGNAETFIYQMRVALERCIDKKILLLEDDYLWLPDTFSKLFRAVDEVPFVSPYDHPGHYSEERFRNITWDIKTFPDFMLRENPSTTLTFATTEYHLLKNIDVFSYYNIKDHELWNEVGNIWSFTPSIATHCVEQFLAPNFSHITW